METFSALLAICARNSPVPVTSPHKGKWRGALTFSLICARINGWGWWFETLSRPLWRHCNDVGSVKVCNLFFSLFIVRIHIWISKNGEGRPEANHNKTQQNHYNDVIMSAIAPQITSLTIVCSAVYSGADQRKHQSTASLAFVRGIHRWLVNSPNKGPVTRKMFPFDDVIMTWTVGIHWKQNIVNLSTSSSLVAL